MTLSAYQKTRHPAGALLSALWATLLLASCGGGGGSDSAPPRPYTPPIEREARTSVAAATYTDSWKLGAFNRLNEIRAQAGIGLLTQNASVDQAAQNHSTYQVNHSKIEHTETSGGADRTGGGPDERIRAITAPPYLDLKTSTEVISPVLVRNSTAAQSGLNLVDGLMSAPYHRSAMLSPEWSDMGVGFDARGGQANMTINLARTEANTQGAPKTQLIIWPPDGSTNMPTAMPGEDPDPIPENKGAPAGYPASVQSNPLLGIRVGNITQFEISDLSGAVVATKLLDSSDKELAGGLFVAALPKAPLAKNTRYKVTFKADLQKGGAIFKEDTPISKTWYFTTGDKFDF
jgi:uncharacterized protein YkwD